MPRDRGPRTRIARGIYEDAFGRAAIVQVGHGPQARRKERRFPFTASIRDIQRWQDDARRALRLTQHVAGRHTLAADVERYIAQVQHLVSWRELRAELRAWTVRLGDRPRWTVTAEDVRLARVVWLDAKVAPRTVNHRVDALRRLYRALDGRRAETPCDDVRPLSVAPRPPQGVPVAVIRATYSGLLAQEAAGRLRSAKSRARFMVCAACGTRPSEVMRAQPTDVDLERRVWRTRTGKGGYRPGGLYLNDDMLAAWQLFAEAGAWGVFEVSAWNRTLRSAGWPAGLRVYELRHSVGLELSDAGTDLADISAWLGHTRPLTTRSHYVPVQAGRMRAMSDRLAGRIDWTTAHVVPDGTGDRATPPQAPRGSPRDGHAPVSSDHRPSTPEGE